MTWEAWLRACRVHARSAMHRRRRERAEEIIHEAARQSAGLYAVGVSGGKDSVAMAGLIAKCGYQATLPLVYVHSELDIPGTREIVEGLAEQLDMNLDIIVPDGLDEHVSRIARQFGLPAPQRPASGEYDEWSLLEAFPANVDIVDHAGLLYRAVAAGNVLVAYMYDTGLRGMLCGMRSEESRGRAMNRATRGAIYRSIVDGTWMIQPIVDWRALDVYAYLIEHDLPLHPHYRATHEWSCGQMEPGRIRVGSCIPVETIARHGSLAELRGVYPELFARLARARPELVRYT